MNDQTEVLYTVGWICTAQAEYDAAQAFLDERHKSSVPSTADGNTVFALGTIGAHNVLIAYLCRREHGAAATAIAARDMHRTFGKTRLNLIVGTAGGAPSEKHDVRLGDVVVSAAGKEGGAVFWYDSAETISCGKFRGICFFPQPPMVLRQAMARLAAEYDSNRRTPANTIETVCKERPDLRRQYERPGPCNDQPHEGGIVHPPESKCCEAAACEGHWPKEESLPERFLHGGTLAVHYGVIASSDRPIEDSQIRDRLTEERDILCFDVGTRDLACHFPNCLVIRGVYHYSDSRSNDEWQSYAAAAAAAYAKDLLYMTPIKQVYGLGVAETQTQTLQRETERVHDLEFVKQQLTAMQESMRRLDGETKRLGGQLAEQELWARRHSNDESNVNGTHEGRCAGCGGVLHERVNELERRLACLEASMGKLGEEPRRQGNEIPEKKSGAQERAAENISKTATEIGGGRNGKGSDVGAYTNTPERHSINQVDPRHDSASLWSAGTAQCQKTLEGHTGWVYSVSFSHDSRLVVSGSKDGTVKLWDTSTGQCQRTLEGHTYWVQSASFSHNSRLVVSGSEDGTIKLWDTSTGQC